MKKILVIEDEPALVKILRSYLEREGFSVTTSTRGDTGYDLSMKQDFDLILLDLNLPGMDGLDIAKAVIDEKGTPIIMVTARVEELDRLRGLEIGADDYICKPYSPKEVVARVKTVLRRVDRKTGEINRIEIGNLTIDIHSHWVRKDGGYIDLTPSEFEILVALAGNPGRVYSRMQLLEIIQGQAYEGYERTIDAHIKNLRAKIERDSKAPDLIRTVFGIGYRLKREDE